MKPGMVVTPVVPGLSKQNQEDHKDKTSLSYRQKQKKISKSKGISKDDGIDGLW